MSDVNCSSLSDLSPEDAILEYQKQTINEDLPKQRFNVCRVDGKGELNRDIISIYKKPDLKLRAIPKVRFEEEDAVGSGPVREFLVLAVQVADEGIPSTSGKSKPLLFFEGQPDHRLPIHDQSLRLTGTFKALRRIIGHSILHGVQVFMDYRQPLSMFCHLMRNLKNHQLWFLKIFLISTYGRW